MRHDMQPAELEKESYTHHHFAWAKCATRVIGGDEKSGELLETTALCTWCSRLAANEFPGKKPNTFYGKPTVVSFVMKGRSYIRAAKFRTHESTLQHKHAAITLRANNPLQGSVIAEGVPKQDDADLRIGIKDEFEFAMPRNRAASEAAVHQWLRANSLHYWLPKFEECAALGYGIDQDTLLCLTEERLVSDFPETKSIARAKLLAKIERLKDGSESILSGSDTHQSAEGGRSSQRSHHRGRDSIPSAERASHSPSSSSSNSSSCSGALLTSGSSPKSAASIGPRLPALTRGGQPIESDGVLNRRSVESDGVLNRRNAPCEINTRDIRGSSPYSTSSQGAGGSSSCSGGKRDTRESSPYSAGSQDGGGSSSCTGGKRDTRESSPNSVGSQDCEGGRASSTCASNARDARSPVALSPSPLVITGSSSSANSRGARSSSPNGAGALPSSPNLVGARSSSPNGAGARPSSPNGVGALKTHRSSPHDDTPHVIDTHMIDVSDETPGAKPTPTPSSNGSSASPRERSSTPTPPPSLSSPQLHKDLDSVLQPLNERKLRALLQKPQSASSTRNTPDTKEDSSRPANASAPHDASRRFTCGFCPRTFVSNFSLVVHTRSHTGERPFVCPKSGCDKHYRTKGNLVRHLRSHAIQPRAPLRDCVGMQL